MIENSETKALHDWVLNNAVALINKKGGIQTDYFFLDLVSFIANKNALNATIYYETKNPKNRKFKSKIGDYTFNFVPFTDKKLKENLDLEIRFLISSALGCYASIEPETLNDPFNYCKDKVDIYDITDLFYNDLVKCYNDSIKYEIALTDTNRPSIVLAQRNIEILTSLVDGNTIICAYNKGTDICKNELMDAILRKEPLYELQELPEGTTEEEWNKDFYQSLKDTFSSIIDSLGELIEKLKTTKDNNIC